MNKRALRKIYKDKRKSLVRKDLELFSQKISSQFFKHFSLGNTSVLHVFLPITTLNEVLTWYIIEKIQKEYANITLTTSISDFTTYEMQTVKLGSTQMLAKNKYGILEPQKKEYLPDEQIDTILLPLLIFDTNGYRVGYGKGFYDRFLAKCNPHVRKVGLCMFEPVPMITDTEPTDQKMDFCVTPERVYTF